MVNSGWIRGEFVNIQQFTHSYHFCNCFLKSDHLSLKMKISKFLEIHPNLKMTSYVAWFWTIHFFKYISIWIWNFVPSSKLCLLSHFPAAIKLDQARGSVVWIFSVVHRMMEATIIFQNTRKLIELQIVKMDLFSQNLWLGLFSLI